MSATDFKPTFYEATSPAAARYPALSGNTETDVCIVGGGLAGLTAARALAQGGRAVVLVEAGRLGGQASGRNGGFVSAGFSESIETLERKLGPAHARRLWDASVGGCRQVRETIGHLGLAEAVGGEGKLKVSRIDDVAASRARAERMNRDYGTDYEIWDTERVRGALRSRRYFSAVHDPHGFHIQPVLYARAVARSAEAAGARLFEDSPAVGIAESGADWLVSASRGTISARHVILAANVGTARVSRQLGRAILPVATYVVVTERLGDRLREAIRYAGAISDTRRAGDYYRVVDGDRLLWGGRITTASGVPPRLPEIMTSDILSVYPQLGAFRIEHAWTGLMGYPFHKMPILGLVAGSERSGAWSLTGFGGHGLNTSAMGADLIARAILSGDPAWRMFEPFGARWGGGLIGRLATQAEYWRLRALDWWEERRAAGRSVTELPGEGGHERAAGQGRHST